MKFLISGGSGFIGSNFIKYMLNKYKNYTFVNYDILTYAGNTQNLSDINGHPNYHFVMGDICDRDLLVKTVKQYNIDMFINFAAESHVDRSIEDPYVFCKTNILGTQTLLDVSKSLEIKKFIQISTDEVYGSITGNGLFTEEHPLQPNSPYSASKASADLLVRAYHKTYGLNVNITRCSNNYGPYQHSEKLIPSMIIKAINSKNLPIYGDGENIRDWLHVYDHCTAIDKVTHYGLSGEIYNIGSNNEKTNNQVVSYILNKIGASTDLITYVSDRKGHDRRYAIDSSKIQRELSWSPTYNFHDGLDQTITWYLNNKQWWNQHLHDGVDQ
ncbi:hypothetical protein Q75_13490 [Bacillus coahuilensis p1.1.43]|uniref:dTDP-glucose 4,6-dehydratase n=1 Tax=Bacillus coahuilensis p1.1.43 TaxID=1150625 RepID=A0A147K670_9BACI|nr:dTDP-glucose 4,6-dehydratase [Bacillus coahuilensis]KUP05258.1 hypothetical protein Q75_13490 [Bacillus coahuilensis p1.1.43]